MEIVYHRNDCWSIYLFYVTLVSATNGYSGADIESVVKDSIEMVFVTGKSKVTTQDILDSIKQTHSLSEIMKEPIEQMKKLYEQNKFKSAS